MAGNADRRARALVAWLPSREVRRLKRGAYDNARHQRAREAMRRRPPELDQSGLVASWPAELEPHASALRDSQGAQYMFSGGWELVLVTDLRRVIAAQPTVFVGATDDEQPDLEQLDLAATAQLTLPLSPPAPELKTSFDEDRQTWNITSLSPNLRITGTFGGEIRPNEHGFGFLVQVLPSFLAVGEFAGRYVLRDGYHRAFRLLAAGVFAVPAFVRRFGDGESLFRRGMLPEAIYTGERPPTLQDYHDDVLADDIWLDPGETTVRIHAVPPELAFGRLA